MKAILSTLCLLLCGADWIAPKGTATFEVVDGIVVPFMGTVKPEEAWRFDEHAECTDLWIGKLPAKDGPHEFAMVRANKELYLVRKDALLPVAVAEKDWPCHEGQSHIDSRNDRSRWAPQFPPLPWPGVVNSETDYIPAGD